MPFRSAVIGTGFIGPVHLEALRRIGVEVAAVIGSSPEKSIAAADRFGISSTHRTLADVLDDPSIDVVHVASPNRLHFEHAAAVLRSRKHVMCEKPLGLNSAETAELVQIAEHSGQRAAVAHNIRFYPMCVESATRVRSGSDIAPGFGEVLHVQGGYVQDWLLKPTDFNWRVTTEHGGATRAIADIGTHWMDLIQFITGQSIVAVMARLHTVHPTRYRPTGTTSTFGAGDGPTEAVTVQTEDCGTVAFELSGGSIGNLFVSQTTAGRKNCLRFEIAGSNATLAFNSERPNELWIGHRDGPNETLMRDPALLQPSAAGITDYPGGHNEGFPDTFKQLFAAFYDSIANPDSTGGPESTGGPSPIGSPRSTENWGNVHAAVPTFADGHREVLLCEAILRSHQTRQWVEIAT